MTTREARLLDKLEMKARFAQCVFVLFRIPNNARSTPTVSDPHSL
jgi:hypothetical protein